MSIRIINEEKTENKKNKSYFVTDKVVTDIEEIRVLTNSIDYNETLEKMITVTKEHLKDELKNKKLA